MTDDTTLDRRGFVRRAGGALAGLLGATGAGAARRSNRAEQAGGITRFPMVLPDADVFEATYVNLAVIVGLPVDVEDRPPAECIPDDAGRLRAYDAAVADLTESSILGGDGDAVGEVIRTRAYAFRQLGPGGAYRVVGGTSCDGYVRVTVHDLADQFDVTVNVNTTSR